MNTEYPIDGTVYIVKNDDATWSMTDNGEETDSLDYETAVKYALEETITDEDIDSWHDGNGYTPHLARLMAQFPIPVVIQIWGSRDGIEPLTIDVSAE